jgi:hypothetical protein
MTYEDENAGLYLDEFDSRRPDDGVIRPRA